MFYMSVTKTSHNVFGWYTMNLCKSYSAENSVQLLKKCKIQTHSHKSVVGHYTYMDIIEICVIKLLNVLYAGDEAIKQHL